MIFKKDEDRSIPSVGAFSLTPSDGGSERDSIPPSSLSATDEEEQLERFVMRLIRTVIDG